MVWYSRDQIRDPRFASCYGGFGWVRVASITTKSTKKDTRERYCVKYELSAHNHTESQGHITRTHEEIGNKATQHRSVTSDWRVLQRPGGYLGCRCASYYACLALLHALLLFSLRSNAQGDIKCLLLLDELELGQRLRVKARGVTEKDD